MAWHIYQSRNRESRRSPRWTWLRNSISDLSQIRVIKFTGILARSDLGGGTWVKVVRYLPLASRNPHPIVVYFFRPIMDPSLVSISYTVTTF